jgi:ribonuclease Z
MDLKRAMRAGASGEHPIRVVWSEQGSRRDRTFALQDLRRDLVRISPGQKLAYVTDVAHSPENIEKITKLAWRADLFYCEAGYPERDCDRARARFHLTAGQAGRLAAAAQVRRLSVFHFSPKYRDCPGELLDEAMTAFRERQST